MASILDNVLAAMQDADEMGGPEGMDYVNLMRNIAAAANDRARNCLYLVLSTKYPSLEFSVGRASSGGIEGVIYLFANDMAIHDPTDDDCSRPGDPEYYGLSKDDAEALRDFNYSLVQQYVSGGE